MIGFKIGDIIYHKYIENYYHQNSIWEVVDKTNQYYTKIKCIKSNHWFELNDIQEFDNCVLDDRFLKFEKRKSEDILNEWI